MKLSIELKDKENYQIKKIKRYSFPVRLAKKSLIFLLIVGFCLLALAIVGCKKDDDTMLGQELQLPQVDLTDIDAFTYSESLDDRGYWSGVKAQKYVELCDYKNIEIASYIHTISDDEFDQEIDALLAAYTTTDLITNRQVKDGDMVNIDYVGSIDGEEFDGGNTNEMGTDVIIGVTSYIDDFLEQLIGQEPGTTIDVNVTFPDDYMSEELSGQEAVFVTTINYIVEEKTPELTDEFVSDNFGASDDWHTAQELREGLKNAMQKSAVASYLQNYLQDNCPIQKIPNSMLLYQQRSMLSYYYDYASSYGLELEEFITGYLNSESIDSLIEDNQEQLVEQAKYFLIMQAIAEKDKLTVSDEETREFFLDLTDEEYTQMTELAGLPYLKMVALNQKVLEQLIEVAILK